MPEPTLSSTVALSIIRGLAGIKDYPIHLEAEKRRADVLMECCESVSHARLVIEEFDAAEDFHAVTGDSIRSAAKRLAEVCQCGKAKWAHREGGACKRFGAAPAEDEEWTKTPTGYTQFRQSVPMVPGVRWEVCLQVEAMRIAMGLKGTPPDDKRLILDYERFPDAMESLRLGQEPDYKLLESQMRVAFPLMWKGAKHRLSLDVLTTERIAGIEKKYAVESITLES